MNKLKSIILDKLPSIETEKDEKDFYDIYWQFILEYQLIFLPNYTIIFWGFKVKLSPNEYDLLKSIIGLYSKNECETGYTETQIIKPINYHRVNTSKSPLKSFQRFIITNTSSIKKKISIAILNRIIEQIKYQKYNPFNSSQKDITHFNIEEYCNKLQNKKSFSTKVMASSLNLVYFYSELMGYVKHNSLPYSDFCPLKAIRKLIYPVKGQKHNSKHRNYTTDYTFNSVIDKKIRKRKVRSDKGIKKSWLKATDNKVKLEKWFNYAPVKIKYNVQNYVNR